MRGVLTFKLRLALSYELQGPGNLSTRNTFINIRVKKLRGRHVSGSEL